MGGDMVRIETPRCMECGKTGTLLVPMEDWIKWMAKDRPLIQHCFPTLSRDLREQILTGTHPECWEKMFPPEEDEITLPVFRTGRAYDPNKPLETLETEDVQS